MNRRAIGVLLTGTALYWLLAYGLPDLREVVPVALPVGLGAALVYAVSMRGEREATPGPRERLADFGQRSARGRFGVAFGAG